MFLECSLLVFLEECPLQRLKMDLDRLVIIGDLNIKASLTVSIL